MATKEKGLTGIREDVRGFTGGRPGPVYDSTKNGKSRIRFELASGASNEKIGKFPTWRHCIGYGKVADELKDLSSGALVKVSGWVTTEWLCDEYFKPVLNDAGHYKTKEYLILYKAEVLRYEKAKPQPELLLAYS